MAAPRAVQAVQVSVLESYLLAQLAAAVNSTIAAASPAIPPNPLKVFELKQRLSQSIIGSLYWGLRGCRCRFQGVAPCHNGAIRAKRGKATARGGQLPSGAWLGGVQNLFTEEHTSNAL